MTDLEDVGPVTNSTVQITRGGITESQHEIALAIVNSKGELLGSVGNVALATFARSSAKPIQAIPLVESGAADYYHFDEADLALSCASHSSELQHTNRVAEMLARIGLDESYLQCGPHLPHNMQTYDRITLAGGKLTSLYSNCSGKHTGMLAYTQFMKQDVKTYHQIEHPLQQQILGLVSQLTEVDIAQIAIGADGCGVPTFGLPLNHWALAFAKFADPSAHPHAEAMARISAAMRGHPELVGGTDRFDTDLMKATQGRILAKGGAEGFMAVVVPEKKFAITMKVVDGNSRAIPPSIVKVLWELDVISVPERTELNKYAHPKLTNTRNETVGEIIADFDLSAVYR